jgi:hypothetical protein
MLLPEPHFLLHAPQSPAFHLPLPLPSPPPPPPTHAPPEQACSSAGFGVILLHFQNVPFLFFDSFQHSTARVCVQSFVQSVQSPGFQLSASTAVPTKSTQSSVRASSRPDRRTFIARRRHIAAVAIDKLYGCVQIDSIYMDVKFRCAAASRERTQ